MAHSSSISTRVEYVVPASYYIYIYCFCCSFFFLTARSILLTRRRDYNLTDITVRFLSSKPVTSGDHDEGLQRGSQHAKPEPGPRTTGGTRQSKRIRQGRGRREDTRLRISKTTTVKDIKVQVRDFPPLPALASVYRSISLSMLAVARVTQDSDDLPEVVLQGSRVAGQHPHGRIPGYFDERYPRPPGGS